MKTILVSAIVISMCPTVAGAAPAAEKMRESVERVLATLPEQSRAQALRPFDDRDRVDWHYAPRSRNGLPLKHMDARSREAVHDLLRAALSASGYRKVVNIIELELVLREIETIGWMRDPERYHLTVTACPVPGLAGDGALKGTTSHSTSPSPATSWRSARRASSAPIRPPWRRVPRKGCARSAKSTMRAGRSSIRSMPGNGAKR